MVVGKFAIEGTKEDFYPNIDFKIVSREKWNAMPPKSTESLPLPAQRVFFMFTDTNRCESKKDCITAMQGLQKHYMDLGMPDLPFSFLVGGDLRVYEGRGWGVKISRTDINRWNDERVVIGYICPQKENDDRTKNMLRKGYQVMYYGIQNRYLEDFDKYDGKTVNVEDETEVLKKYYEGVLENEAMDMEKAERREQRRKAREEAKRKATDNETKDTTEDVVKEETLNVQNINIEEGT